MTDETDWDEYGRLQDHVSAIREHINGARLSLAKIAPDFPRGSIPEQRLSALIADLERLPGHARDVLSAAERKRSAA